MKLSNERKDRVTMTLLVLGGSVLCISGGDPLDGWPMSSDVGDSNSKL